MPAPRDGLRAGPQLRAILDVLLPHFALRTPDSEVVISGPNTYIDAGILIDGEYFNLHLERRPRDKDYHIENVRDPVPFVPTPAAQAQADGYPPVQGYGFASIPVRQFSSAEELAAAIAEGIDRARTNVRAQAPVPTARAEEPRITFGQLLAAVRQNVSSGDPTMSEEQERQNQEEIAEMLFEAARRFQA